MEELRTYHSRAKRLERELAEARLQYATCSNEYRRAIADLTASRMNGLAAVAALEQAREACVVRKHKDGFWLILHNEKGDAAINLFYERRGSIVEAVLEAAARDVGTRPVDLQATRCLEP